MKFRMIIITSLLCLFLLGCDTGSSSGGGDPEPNPEPETYTITYTAPFADGGTVPVDENTYEANYMGFIYAKGNEGSLTRAGYIFMGWTPVSGMDLDTYYVADSFLSVGVEDVVLQAVWIAETELEEYSCGLTLEGLYINSYLGNQTDIIVPAEIGDIPVFSLSLSDNSSSSNLTSINISNGIKCLWRIDSSPNLQTLTIPASLEIIDYDDVICPNLTTINVDSTSEFFTVIDGLLYSKDGKELCYFPKGLMTGSSYTVSSNVEILSSGLFSSWDNLTSITIPSSVKEIGGGAFSGCESLNNIDISTLPLTQLYGSTFSGCYNLTSITLPSTITKIGMEDFYHCYNLETIVLPTSLEMIDRRAFAYCSKLTNPDFPSSIVNISLSAFTNCNGLTNLMLPDDLRYIEAYAFSSCKELTDVTISASVIRIGNCAFLGCEKLVNVYLEGSVPPEMSYPDVFTGNHADRKFYVPAGSRDAYISAPYWSDLADDIIEI